MKITIKIYFIDDYFDSIIFINSMKLDTIINKIVETLQEERNHI